MDIWRLTIRRSEMDAGRGYSCRSATIASTHIARRVFGFELMLGGTWAVTLDAGGDDSGSASAAMNMCGNIGAAISPPGLAYLVRS